jgi:hypothetical protein
MWPNPGQTTVTATAAATMPLPNLNDGADTRACYLRKDSITKALRTAKPENQPVWDRSVKRITLDHHEPVRTQNGEHFTESAGLGVVFIL